jgi:hypothetical protein
MFLSFFILFLKEMTWIMFSKAVLRFVKPVESFLIMPYFFFIFEDAVV